MAYILQVDFPFRGPWGAEMAKAMKGLAEDIAREPGLIRKIWTENPAEHRAGGLYLFATAEAAEAYAAKHIPRLESFGISDIVARHFAVNHALSEITGLTLPA